MLVFAELSKVDFKDEKDSLGESSIPTYMSALTDRWMKGLDVGVAQFPTNANARREVWNAVTESDSPCLKHTLTLVPFLCSCSCYSADWGAIRTEGLCICVSPPVSDDSSRWASPDAALWFVVSWMCWFLNNIKCFVEMQTIWRLRAFSKIKHLEILDSCPSRVVAMGTIRRRLVVERDVSQTQINRHVQCQHTFWLSSPLSPCVHSYIYRGYFISFLFKYLNIEYVEVYISWQKLYYKGNGEHVFCLGFIRLEFMEGFGGAHSIRK